jgi:uncharacterized membrane protein
MSGETFELVVATFTGEKGAEDALNLVKEAQKDQNFKLSDAAVLHREENNQLKIKETGDTSGGKGAVIGGVIGGAIGLIGGPLALVTGALGAAIGGLAAKMSDADFPDYQLEEIGRRLRPGMSALVALFVSPEPVDFESILKKAGAVTVKTAPLDKAVLSATGPESAGFVSSGSGKDNFFEKAAGATAINLMNEIAREENKPSDQDPIEGN